MKLAACKRCGEPVLELEGQFSKLDSLYIKGEFPPPETAGWWHASCLAESKVALAWYEVRLRNFRDVRRYQLVADYPDWTVLRDPNRGKIVAFGRKGEILSLSRDRRMARAVESGYIYPKFEEEYHLELEDSALVQTIQEGLLVTGAFSLKAVLGAMGIANRIVHSEAIANSAFHLDGLLQRNWDKNPVSARLRYGVFVPAELAAHTDEVVRNLKMQQRTDQSVLIERHVIAAQPGAPSMRGDPSHEVIAEVDNAELAAEELARNGRTSRKCLRCSGPLAVEYLGASYVVRCEHEGRVIFASRGL